MGKQSKGNNQHKQAQNMRGNNPAAPGQGGGRGDTKAKSSNPKDWKNEPGNQS